MPDVRISELPAASQANAADILPASQGSTTRRVTVQQIADFARQVAINPQTGTAYTLGLADAGRKVRAANAAAITVTVPANAAVAIPVGSVIGIRQVGAGRVTCSPSGGVTINTPTGFLPATGRQGAEIMLHKVGADEWDITGDLGT